MSIGTKQITRYFRQVLERGELEAVGFGPGDGPFIDISREDLEDGSLPDDETQRLRDAYRTAHPKHPRESPIPVVVSTLSLHEDGGHQGLVLFPGELHRDGTLDLAAEAGRAPWVPAERLTIPSGQDREVMLGTLQRFGELHRRAMPALISRAGEATFDADGSGLTRILALGDELLKGLTGKPPAQFAADINADLGRDAVEHERCYIAPYDRISAVGALLQLFDAIEHGDRLPPLYRRMLVGTPPHDRRGSSTVHEGAGLLTTAIASRGSMADSFPLTDSQRVAVHAHLLGGSGEVSAVSGPPGTGKTTMLQSIVATLLTQRALDRDDAPVIVGMSTNNQAVTNIIESFASVAKAEHGPLDARWLPRRIGDEISQHEPLPSLAVYAPSAAKLKSAEHKYLVEQRDRSKTYAAYTSEDYLLAARTAFTAKAGEYLAAAGVTAPPTALGKVCELLHRALTEVDQARVALLQRMGDTGPTDQYRQLARHVAHLPWLQPLQDPQRLAALAEASDVLNLDQKLDVTLRYAEFWLAVHYFEAQFLLFDEPLREAERWKNTPAVQDRYWRHAASLTPCFVMTAYQVPKYFALYVKDGEPADFDMGRIDLLIVDEAGQVDTPIGIANFALADRALVVGDERQLAPVWSVDEETDAEIAASAGIERDPWERVLQPRGLTASYGSSLMRAASVASHWWYGHPEDPKPGLFLAEHFRCVPDIIGYCNDLLYEGLLRPMRKADSSRLHGTGPAFELVSVRDSVDSTEGSSRQNLPEARAVARWIAENHDRFHRLYHEDVEQENDRAKPTEIIAVVTPFAAQARLITNELRRVAREVPGAPEDLARRITVGTAHRLQGAERPVVLFSAAYGSNSGTASFIDANLELMNVAVSRAKDLFVVFAATNRWNSGPVFGLMENYGTHAEAVDAGARADASAPEANTSDLDEPSPAPQASPAQQPSKPQAVVPSTADSQGADPVVVSSLLHIWKREGLLTAEDTALTAAQLNPRLLAAGVLTGEPGDWHPTALAEAIGVVSETREARDGSSYQAIVYQEQAQRILAQMYRDGRI